MDKLNAVLDALRALGTDNIAICSYRQKHIVSISADTESEVHALAATLGSSTPRVITGTTERDRWLESTLRTDAVSVTVTARAVL